MELIEWLLVAWPVLGVWWIDAVGRHHGYSDSGEVWRAVTGVMFAPVAVPLLFILMFLAVDPRENLFSGVLAIVVGPLALDVVSLVRKVIGALGLDPYIERVSAALSESESGSERGSRVPERWSKDG